MLFHKHSWKILDKTVIPSAYEQMKERMTSVERGGPWLFEQKIVFVFQCEKCKAIRIRTESNPE